MAASLQRDDKVTLTFAHPITDLEGENAVHETHGTVLAVDEHGVRLQIENESIIFVPWRMVGMVIIQENSQRGSFSVARSY